jgi:DNA-binding transcriptional ArsR family regulator
MFIDIIMFMDKIFKALADQNRRKILTLLKNGELSVNELLKGFEIGQATLSSHLSILRKAQLVEYRILGKQRIYRLNRDLLVAFAENMRKFVGRLDESFVEEIAIRGKRV